MSELLEMLIGIGIVYFLGLLGASVLTASMALLAKYSEPINRKDVEGTKE